MKIDELGTIFDWTNKNLGPPLDHSSKLWIPVKTSKKGFKDGTELSAIRFSASLTAINHALNFYNLKANSNEQIEAFAQQYATTEKWYLEPRKFSRVRVLVVLDKIEFFKVFNEIKTTINVQNLLESPGENFETSTTTIKKEVDTVSERLGEFERYFFSFNGSIDGFPSSPKLMAPFQRDLQSFPQALDSFVRWNGFGGHVNLVFLIGLDFKVKAIVGWRHPNEKKALLIGFDEFVNSPAVGNPKILSMMLNFYKNTEEFLNKDETWEAWLDKWISPPVFIRPSLETAKKEIQKTSEDIFRSVVPKKLQNPVSSVVDKLEFERRIDGDFKTKMRRRRQGEVDFVGDVAISEPEILLPKMVTLDDVYNEVLHVVDFGALIETILSCFPEVPSFSFSLPDIPTFSFPQLPVIDILFFLRINLEDLILSLIRAILQTLMKLLLEAIQRFCEEGINIGNSKPTYGAADIEDELGTVTADVPGTLEDLGGPGDLLTDFVGDVSSALTPNQLCALLSGEPSNSVLEIVRDILSESTYQPIRKQFETNQQIIDFFLAIGSLIGMVRVKEICDVDTDLGVDFCDQDDYVKILQQRLFDIKRDSGEDIPQEYVDEILARSEELKQEIVGVIEDLVQTENAFDSFEESILDELKSFVPADALPPDVKLATDSVVDGVLDPYADKLNKDIGNYFGFVLQQEAESIASGGLATSRLQTLNQNIQIASLLKLPEVVDGTIDPNIMSIFSNKLLNSDFFTLPGYFGKLSTELANKGFLEKGGFDDLKERIKKSTVGADLNTIAESVSGDKSLFEESLFSETSNLLADSVILKNMLFAGPLMNAFDPNTILYSPEATNAFLRKIDIDFRNSLKNTEIVANILTEPLTEFTTNKIKERVPLVANILSDSFVNIGQRPEDLFTFLSTSGQGDKVNEYLFAFDTLANYLVQQFAGTFSDKDQNVSKLFDRSEILAASIIEGASLAIEGLE